MGSATAGGPVRDPDWAAARLAHERSGECDVSVEKESYEPSVRYHVDVQENECHVETVELTVGLELS